MLCVLFATGTISFNSNNLDDNENNSQQNNVISDDTIDEELQNNLYSMIGILPIEQHNINDCLNVAISNNNYKENYKSIFSWYAYLMGLETYHYGDSQCQDSEECSRAYSCSSCTSITKKDADDIFRIYNFNNDVSEFLYELPTYNNEYSYSRYTNQPVFCEFEIQHNTSSEYINSSDIKIVDQQNIVEFKFPDDHSNENIKNNKNQIVTYYFKKDNNNKYYLNDVVVK